MPLPPDGFVEVIRLRNLIRERGYKFRRAAKSLRTDLWSHPQTMHAINLPRKDLIPSAEVRSMLHYAGMVKDEIERFIGECRS